jgi:hypothetical protein
MTMEAIEQNPVVYELMSEMGWRSEAFDVVEWVQRYAERRYALATGSSPVGEAWELLREATYNQSGLDAGLFGFAPGMALEFLPQRLQREHSSRLLVRAQLWAWAMAVRRTRPRRWRRSVCSSNRPKPRATSPTGRGSTTAWTSRARYLA